MDRDERRNELAAVAASYEREEAAVVEPGFEVPLR